MGVWQRICGEAGDVRPAGFIVQAFPGHRRLNSSVKCEVAGREAIKRAIVLTEKVFGDAEDENAAFFRGLLANEARKNTGSRYDRTTTYGELELSLFFRLLELAEPKPGCSFLDVGSGTGRLVIAAAAAYPSWKCCEGVEILPELTDEAEEFYRLALSRNTEMARCNFSKGSYESFPEIFSDKDIVFAYATTWGEDPFSHELVNFSQFLGSHLKEGAKAVIVDKQLQCGRAFELVDSFTGFNADTGESTGFVYRKM
mmetsp:Transcript_5759/g.17177  ORF Transcript_5759/g.17177 Transcript_5759/m.17177 type:complete len:256 (-) Transcript_5759:1720-2487(-)|eukprot:CAMPEP_0198727330 /NCGR_PEP_ID=MMETSP1475-20131203/4093_1 /TAXON_ID= ORGANISM="Unidentified sp., Strain CCMP1999" /NCGR_SAMPLE_ID=MMETSP1475 /ASSEMBLY_ACC=CAM_ASM_001111 /LENGTH=255 /DNA_ID=CAMNT_0044489357 /DNA_START=223 /DNA_END=990 /DNA_ORIENTATION=+